MDEMDEKTLIQKIQEGNSDLFANLIPSHKQRIYATLLGILRNVQDAEDLTQDVFLKAYRSIHRFQFKSSFYTWIYRIAVNTAIDFKRKRKNKVMVGIDDDKGGLDVLMKDALLKPKAQFDPVTRETKALIHQAIASLDPIHRAILQMREIEGFSYKEIAEQLNISQGTVMSRLFYSRKKLKEQLETMDIR